MKSLCSRYLFAFGLAIIASTPVIAEAASVKGRYSALPGPIHAEVTRVIDGDTIEVQAMIWPDHRVIASVRVDGIDTPELKGKCDAEKDLAIRAKDFTTELVNRHGGEVRLESVRHDKYAGRVVATVVLGAGELLGDSLMQAGLANPYDGKARQPWCSQLTALDVTP